MFNARRGGLSVAVLYWRVEKTQRRTLELAAGLGTRRTAVPRSQPPVSCCSSLFSCTGRTCVKVVARCGAILWNICSSPCDSRSGTSRRTDPSARLRTHAHGSTADSDFRLASPSSANRLATHPHFAAFPGNLWRQQCFLHSVEASCSGQVWSREHPLAMTRN